MSAISSGARQFFSPLTFDFLWEGMGIGEHPYPLRIPSHGATVDERHSLRNRAEAELRAQGIKDARGNVAPIVESWMTTLAQGVLTIDAVHIPDFKKPMISALAATNGHEAVLAVQDPNGIWMRSAPADGLASEIIQLLPPCERGTERSITMSRSDAQRTAPSRVNLPSRAERDREKAEERKPEEKSGLFGLLRKATAAEPEREARPRKSLSERTTGDPRQDYAQLSGQPRLRGGQIGVTGRDENGRKHRAPVLSWFDTATGRYLSLTREGPDGHEWLTISPADARTLRTRLAEMVNLIAQH